MRPCLCFAFNMRTADGKHVELKSKVDGQAQSFRFAVNDDWMDPSFWSSLNRFVEPVGREFVSPSWGGQDFIVLCLTPAEREVLRQELKWPV